MRLNFHVLKQKIQRRRRAEQTNGSLFQTIHQQFYRRMHDLGYLQWMQQNHARYIGGICILATLFSVSAYTFHNTQRQIAPNTAAQYAVHADVNQMASQEAAVDVDSLQAKAKIMQDETIEHDTIVIQNELQSDTIEETQFSNDEKPHYLNPLHLSGYQAPCSGMLQYNYGLGYDAVYDDYRFHREICYGAGDGVVFACIDGVIAAVQMDEHWQLAIETTQGIVWYAGLVTCDVEIGDTITAGMKIGTAEAQVYIQAIDSHT